MTAFQQTRREGGFTLLELLLVIGVAALLLIGGIATYRLVSEGNKTTEATRLLLTLRQEASQFAQQNGGTYTNITFDSTSPAPNNLFVSAGILRDQQRNPFNGSIDIRPSPANAGEVQVTFGDVPRSGCVKMFTAITNPTDITSVQVESKSVRVAAPTNAITPVNAATDCSASTADMIWTLK